MITSEANNPTTADLTIAGKDPTAAHPSAGSFTHKLLSFDKRQPLAADII